MAVQVDNFGSLVKTPTGQIVTTARAASAEAVRISGDILNSAHISPNGVLSSVEGAVTELKSAIAGVDNFTNFSNNVGGQSAVSTAGQGHPGDRSGAEPPWENELEKFVSYSSIFTLSCLTTEDLNLPDFSYRQKPPEHRRPQRDGRDAPQAPRPRPRHAEPGPRPPRAGDDPPHHRPGRLLLPRRDHPDTNMRHYIYIYKERERDF